VGDFNAVLGAHQKRGRRLPPPISCTDFLTWTNANLLLHMNTTRVHYTWNNSRLDSDSVFLRLDRQFVMKHGRTFGEALLARH